MWPRHPALQKAQMFAVSAVALFAVWLPVFRSPPRDSFPLSTYPMFSTLLPAVSKVDLVVGIDASGEEVRLSPELIAGTDEVIIAGSTVRQSVRSGETDEMCSLVADRVARSDNDSVVEIVVKTDEIDAVRWFADDKTPESTTVHSRCEVER